MAAQSKIDPTRSALVLMDFQPALLASLESGSNGLMSNAETALGWARDCGLRIAHVRLAFREADFDAIPSRNKAVSRLKGRITLMDGAPEADIDGRLQPRADEIVVRKTRFGSFSTTDLGRQLDAAGARTLMLAGIRTSGAVLSTLREAADLDFGLYVLSDACADGDPHVHDMLMNHVFPHQADVITTAELETLA